MAPQVDDLQARVEELAEALERVERRLDDLEGREEARAEAPPADPPLAREALAEEVSAPALPSLTAGAIPLVGRTLVVLGGAYLFRAATASAVVPALAGAAAGFVYAAWWLVQADRSAAAGQRLSAVFHAIAAAAIAYPLIWETTVHFQLLPAPAAAAALVLFLDLAIVVAWRRGLEGIAWTVLLATLVTTTGLIFATNEYTVFAVALLFVAVPVEAIAARDRWLGLRWPVAIALDLAVLMLAAAVRSDGSPEAYTAALPGRAIAVGLALPLLYLTSVGARTLGRARTITPFELAQATMALLIGFGGVLRVIAVTDADPVPVGIAAGLLGAICYAVAFGSIDRSLGRGRNFYGYTTFAGLLIGLGTWATLAGVALSLTWSVFALLGVALGSWFDRITLRVHGAVFLSAAAYASGLFAYIFQRLAADPTAGWQPVTAAAAAVAVLAAACYAIVVVVPVGGGSPWSRRLPELVIAAVFGSSVAGLTAGWLGQSAVGGWIAASDAASVAASRTAVLALLAVLFAWAGRRRSLVELTWLVYPLLAATGLKLLLEDFRHGEPMTLFLSLAFYGGALVVTPRLMKAAPRSA